ncbi:MAG: ABC transporter ATP-binding protein/permease [Firmicutes bacterium]|nr:ABC transporter ATP-binding protein/permease [Bacillota bacterium]
MSNKENGQKFSQTVRSTKYILGLIMGKKHGKTYLFLKLSIALINALFSVSYTVFPGLIINALIDGEEMTTVFMYVSVLLMTPVVSYIVNSVWSYFLTKLNIELGLDFQCDFDLHSMSMDYEIFDSPAIKILRQRANDTSFSILSYADLVFNAISAIASLVAISSIIATLHPLIILLVLVLIFINSRVTKKYNAYDFTQGQKLSAYDNYDWAISYMIFEEPYAKEIRLFNLKKFLSDMYAANQKAREKEVLRQKIKYLLYSFVSIFTNLVQQFVLYGYLVYRVVFQAMPIGNVTIYLSATSQFSGALKRVLDSYLELAKTGLNIAEYEEFMSLGNKNSGSGKDTPVYDENSTIEFRNVSFKYPGSENYAIRNLSIKINGNEHLCIVGENGSGKSTFIKLLTRLYTPTEGEILLNGKNVMSYDYEKYLALFAPVFQDFVHYYMSLEKNIILSKPLDKELFDKTCSDTGLDKLAAKLPKGYDTSVEKDIDPEGFRPSGGEDQRIAIARACYHGGEIYLLDEPTAALDPNAEYEIFTQFDNMITSKCAVLITHRLSAVQLSDKVAVFADGHVAEYGTHAGLYAKGGLYTDMFDKQSKFYRELPTESETCEDTESDTSEDE